MKNWYKLTHLESNKGIKFDATGATKYKSSSQQTQKSSRGVIAMRIPFIMIHRAHMHAGIWKEELQLRPFSISLSLSCAFVYYYK